MAKELLVTLLVVITAQAYVRAEDFAVVGYVPLPLPPPQKNNNKTACAHVEHIPH